MMKQVYITLTNKNNKTTSIINRHKFTKHDKMIDLLKTNRDCYIRIEFI